MSMKDYTAVLADENGDSYETILAREGGATPFLYRALFETDANGKKVLDDLMNRFYSPASFVPDNQYRTAYNEGLRGVVIHIMNQINLAKQQSEETNNG